MKTTFTGNIPLGKLDGENVRLAPPSWDCGWYWGFGYIQNRNLHTHFDSFDRENNRNMFDSIKARFTEWKLTDADTWTFCELIKTFYALEETAEVLGRGGSNYTKNPCAEIIKSKSETKRINEIVLPAIFDAIWKLFEEGPKRKRDEAKAKLEKEKAEAKEKIDKYEKEIVSLEKKISEVESVSIL